MVAWGGGVKTTENNGPYFLYSVKQIKEGIHPLFLIGDLGSLYLSSAVCSLNSEGFKNLWVEVRGSYARASQK